MIDFPRRVSAVSDKAVEVLRPSSEGNLLHLPITTRVTPAATMQIAMPLSILSRRAIGPFV